MMFLIDPIFSLVALVTIVMLYIWLARKELETDGRGDIRGGLFLALAERASRVADKFPRHQVTWKPDLLVPIEDPEVWAGPLLFIRNITYPSGSIFAFTITQEEGTQEQNEALNELLFPLKEQNILVNSAVIEAQEFLHGAKSVIQTLRGGAFRPNTLFLTIGDNYNESFDDNSLTFAEKVQQRLGLNSKKANIVSQLAALTIKYEMGVIILRQHSRMAFGMQQNINLWLRDKSPNWHLAMLVALQLQLNWDAKINLVTVSSQAGQDEERLYRFLEHLSDQARLSSMTDFHVLPGPFPLALETAPRADINIFGLSPSNEIPLKFIQEVSDAAKSSCVFVIDSGRESALA